MAQQEDISAHQVPVSSVTFVREMQVITGDRFRGYRAPGGEVTDVRVNCGAYAPEAGRLTDAQAAAHAVTTLNEQRTRRAERIRRGEPVRVQTRLTAED